MKTVLLISKMFFTIMQCWMQCFIKAIVLYTLHHILCIYSLFSPLSVSLAKNGSGRRAGRGLAAGGCGCKLKYQSWSIGSVRCRSFTRIFDRERYSGSLCVFWGEGEGGVLRVVWFICTFYVRPGAVRLLCAWLTTQSIKFLPHITQQLQVSRHFSFLAVQNTHW